MRYRSVTCESCRGQGKDEYGSCDFCDGRGSIDVADPSEGPSWGMVLLAGLLVVAALVTWVMR